MQPRVHFYLRSKLTRSLHQPESDFSFENSQSPCSIQSVSIILTPPSPFLYESDEQLPIVTSRTSQDTNSQASSFSLRINGNSPTGFPSRSLHADNSQARSETISNDTQNDDVIDVHANPDEAFPSSLSDCETACESRTKTGTNTCQFTDSEYRVTAKPSVFSRLGVRNSFILDSTVLERQQLIRTLTQHYSIAHQKNRAEYKCDKCREVVQVNVGMHYKCNLCLAKYVKMEEFAQHRTIGSEKAFCSHCKIDFRNKCELTQHKKTKKHPNPKLCENCLQKAESKPNISQVCEDNSSPEHEIDGSYRCLKCFKRFKLSSQLNTHINHHHRDLDSCISESSHSLLPVRAEVWPPLKLARLSTNELDSDCEITQDMTDAHSV